MTMKKFLSLLLVFLLLAGLLSGCGTAPGKDELSRLTGEAILTDNTGSYYRGECIAEGHRILGSRVSGSRLTVYALTSFGYYGFQNGMFVKVSGSGVIPAVLTFEKDGTDWQLQNVEYPEDGAYYVKSIKRMFPLRYRLAALSGDRHYAELQEQEKVYAAAYLESIGREAVIGEFSDLHPVLLTDLGVSVAVSNELNSRKELGAYPFWIGTEETLEDGVRLVRELSYDEDAGQIVFCTYEWDTGEVTECFVFDAVTGAQLSAGPVVSQMQTAGLPAEPGAGE